MSKRSVSQLAVAAAMLWLVALSALSSAGGANTQDASPSVANPSLSQVLQQLSTSPADPARGRDIWFNNTYGGEKFFWFIQNHPDPARRVNIGQLPVTWRQPRGRSPPYLTVFGQNLRGGGPKNRRLLSRPFAQVLVSRTLTVVGEVAEWPKAAVC